MQKDKEKNYEKLELEVIPFNTEDIIRASGESGAGEEGGDTDAIGKLFFDM